MAQGTITTGTRIALPNAIAANIRWLGLALAILILLGGVAIQTRAGFFAEDSSGHAYGSDDAYISYRYARNFAEGHGLVFNPSDRVEGYSNLLYVLLIAPAFLFTDGLAIYYYSVALNTLFMIGALIIFHLHVRHRLGDLPATLAALLFSMLPAIWVWTASGLETPLALILQIALWVTTERLIDDGASRPHLILLGALTALSILTRADGFVTPAIAAAYLALRRQYRAAAVIAMTIAVTLGAHIAFRMAYYGYPLPNTYYVKVSGSILDRARAAIKQLTQSMPNYGLLPYFLVILAAILATAVDVLRNFRAALATLRFNVFLGAGWLAYFIYTGGDTFDERFLLILLCLGFLILFERAQSLRPTRDLAMIAIPILLIYHGAALLLDPRYDFVSQKYDRWMMLGEFLRDKYPDALLAIDGAGKTPYFSGLQTIDMLGLNDATIGHKPAGDFRNPGHNKFDVDYVFSREPDVIAAWLVIYSTDMAWGLTHDRYTAEGYELRYLINSSPTSQGDRNILDATTLTDEDIALLTVNGYEYGVLVRIND